MNTFDFLQSKVNTKGQTKQKSIINVNFINIAVLIYSDIVE